MGRFGCMMGRFGQCDGPFSAIFLEIKIFGAVLAMGRFGMDPSRMTLNDLESLSETFTDTKYHAVCDS